MTTEDISPRYLDLDLWSNVEALKALFEAQQSAVAAVNPALPAIAAAIDEAVPRLRRGGRLVYVGAGTSARIAAQDGAELGPTFDWPDDKLALAIAGGERALLRAVEHAEDSAEGGAARIAEIGIGPDDVVLGLAASGNTPYTVGAIKAARERGALTIGVTSNAGTALPAAVHHAIVVDTGAEPIAGSTRFKAGTAQKVVLNLFSTQVMTRLGKVYGGMMVDVRATTAKLRRRSARIVMKIAACEEATATKALADAGGSVKRAALIAIGGKSAGALLEKHGGNLRQALAELKR